MKKITILLGLFVSHGILANPLPNPLWNDVQDDFNHQSIQFKLSSKVEAPLERRALTLNEQGLRELLTGTNVSHPSSAKLIKSSTSKGQSVRAKINLPLPNGELIKVNVYDSAILSPAIAEQYPEIKTWRVQGVDNLEITGRLDFTSKGFHGMLSMPDGDIVYIDPDKNNGTNLYYSLSKFENNSRFKTEFNCQVHDKNPVLEGLKDKSLAGRKLAQAPALNLITYRLAIAGTAEYTGSQGGTPSSAYSSMITTINRVNEIYQRDLGIKLEIVSNENLAYTNASTDPYTNSSAVALISENIENLNNKFGAANYDIGHVFGQGRLGGLAYVGATCYDDYKAGGTTGIIDPQGEIFAIEFVAHEMGHQLGATHTFNSEKGGCGNGNRTAETAVEPGSGSTIMSYSGLCETDDLQYNSDAMFHWVSIDQINHYTRVAEGTNCGSRSSTGNLNPVADAGLDGTIPLNTPFFLDGNATGGVTYAWDQIDVGSASTVGTDMGDNAIIRSLLPSSNKDRYIPRLSDLFTFADEENKKETIGEILPITVRSLTFAFVVRDNNGGIDSDLKTLDVRDTGSVFKVLSQSSSTKFTTGEAVDIAWATGRTNNAPINCNKVDIQLIREDGTKNMLLANTDNDGGQQLIVPVNTPTMTNARVMIACSSQPFFHISKGDIRVEKGVSAGDTTPPVITIIGSSNISITKGTNYTDAGATAQDKIDGTVSVTKTGSVNTAVVGTYRINYSATDAAGNTASAVRIVQVVSASDTIPPVITLKGESSIEIVRGSVYSDAGATATDNVDSIVSVKRTGTVNTNVVGTYQLVYTATDAAGNTSSKTRTVKVISETGTDTESPVITLLGNSVITLKIGQTYHEPGFTAHDNQDGNVSVIVSGTVDTSTLGSYTLTYTARDAAGNVVRTMRIVKVVAANVTDTTAPVINLQGSSSITLTEGDNFNDPGASAIDDTDGNIQVHVSGSVDANNPGTYVLTYSATDTAGNTSTVTRTVIVIKENNGTKNNEDSTGGGMGFLLLPLVFIGLRRKFTKKS